MCKYNQKRILFFFILRKTSGSSLMCNWHQKGHEVFWVRIFRKLDKFFIGFSVIKSILSIVPTKVFNKWTNWLHASNFVLSRKTDVGKWLAWDRVVTFECHSSTSLVLWTKSADLFNIGSDALRKTLYFCNSCQFLHLKSKFSETK